MVCQNKHEKIQLFVILYLILNFNSNKEFLKQEGVISMTISLLNIHIFDKSDYTVIVCLISDQWSMYLHIIL